MSQEKNDQEVLHENGPVKMIFCAVQDEGMNLFFFLPVILQNSQICWSQQNLPASLL